MKKLVALLVALLCLPIFSLSVSAEGFAHEFNSYCKALLTVDLNSEKVIYAKNADERLPMASLTKIMSYIVAYESIPNLEETVITVDRSVIDILEATDSSTAGIVEGEELTGLQLLNLMMVCSGNDAALVLAQYVDTMSGVVVDFSGLAADGTDTRATNMEGSPFVALMNLKAQELGCADTRFTNPHGLYYPEHYSTARDLVKMTKYALTLPHFQEICATKVYTLPPTNQYEEERVLYTTNRMMDPEETDYYYEPADGVKTGSLEESGYCIAVTARNEKAAYLTIALGSPYQTPEGEDIDLHGEMLDAKELFSWAFSSLDTVTVAATGEAAGSLPVTFCQEKETVSLALSGDVSALLPTKLAEGDIQKAVTLPESLEAPVRKGDVIGEITYSYAGEVLGSSQIVAAEDAEKSRMLVLLDKGEKLVKTPSFQIGAAAGLLLIAALIVFVVCRRARKKRTRQ